MTVKFIKAKSEQTFQMKLETAYRDGYVVTHFSTAAATPGGNYYQDVQVTYSAILEKE